jgi:hypothetical protein
MSNSQRTLERELERLHPPRIPFEQLERRRDRKQRNQRVAAGVLGIAVFALAAIGFVRLLGSEGTPAGDPRSPFAGTWISTSDADGGTQTMTVRVFADGAIEIVVTDDVATVCSGTPSTMTGTGRIEGGARLVIPAPVYTCDDGSKPETLSGPPLDEQLRDWTLVLDAQSDTLSDGVGGLWLREGAEEPSPQPTLSGGMWPQSSLEEVRQAQELADAGDPASTWQVEPEILNGSPNWDVGEGFVDAEIVARFLREELGWEEFRMAPVGQEEYLSNITYVRCAPGGTNPLYPDDPYAGGCAPTIDDLRYETVHFDLTQPVRSEPSGIWVVSNWATGAPFAQVDPRVVEAQATARLEDFLRARIEGEGVEGFVELPDSVEEIPLLYGTTTGAPYERSEIERVGPPVWPFAEMEFVVRLYADGGQTVVEQPISRDGTLYLDAPETTENGQPLGVTYSFFDGEVTFVAADPWRTFGGCCSGGGAWGALSTEEFWNSTEGIELVACEPGLASEDAQALAESIRSDPDQVATAPAAVRVGGAEGLVMDVTIAAGKARESSFQPSGFVVCGASFPSAEVVTGATLDEGIRMRLYLLDLPEGSATRTMVIAISAPEKRFNAATQAAAPIIESIEFHAR